MVVNIDILSRMSLDSKLEPIQYKGRVCINRFEGTISRVSLHYCGRVFFLPLLPMKLWELINEEMGRLHLMIKFWSGREYGNEEEPLIDISHEFWLDGFWSHFDGTIQRPVAWGLTKFERKPCLGKICFSLHQTIHFSPTIGMRHTRL